MSSLTCTGTVMLLSDHTKNVKKTPSVDVTPKIPGTSTRFNHLDLITQGSIKRISKMLQSVDVSVSPYDTAWVAMVPALDSSKNQPCFPETLNWILNNQHPDGSWAFEPNHPLLIKDSLSSTLACVLALRKWNVGEQLVNRGLRFIESNAWASVDKNQRTPIGFEVIFPCMIDKANNFGLTLPINPSSVDAMFHKRDSEVERFLKSDIVGNKANLAYLAEGLRSDHDWKSVMKYQRNNGSLFNSPSATAAALTHVNDYKSFNYLQNLLQRYDNAVPTIYPLDIYTRLRLIDDLEQLGIDRYFNEEIETILDDVYRCWLNGDDEIFSDATCLAMAFRLLRMKGYEVSSDELEGVNEEEKFFSSVSSQYHNINTVLELYKASQVSIFPGEKILDNVYSWTSSFLKQNSVNGICHEDKLRKEVEYALKYPYASLERIENRKSIELYEADNIQLLKTSYRSIGNNRRDLLEFSRKDFNKCQSKHQKELLSVERWVTDSRIDELKFARQKATYGFFAAAAVLFNPEFDDARITWAKFTVLVTLVDDFFDVAASTEEIQNMTELLHKWDDHKTVGYCSEQVEIIFSAIYDTTNEYAAKASMVQGRCVKKHFIEIWLILLDCMTRESKWAKEKIIPSIDDYLEAGYVSVALGPVVLVPLYFLGCKLSEEAIYSREYDDLFKHMSMIARLLNDLATVKREREQGKLNSVVLRVIHGDGSISEEEARVETKKLIEYHRKELLRMVLKSEGSVVPRLCKDVFWKTSKIVHLFYMGTDGYSSPHEMMRFINDVIYEPILVPEY